MKRAQTPSSLLKASLCMWILFHYFKMAETLLTQDHLPYNPDYWLQEGNIRPLDGYIRENPEIGGPEDYLNLKERLNLSDKPRISHGPRKRSPQSYYDPIFKIPLASSPQEHGQEKEDHDFCLQIDCFIFVKHDCCTANFTRELGLRTTSILDGKSHDIFLHKKIGPWDPASNPYLRMGTSWTQSRIPSPYGQPLLSRADEQVNELTQKIVLALDQGDKSIPSWMEQLREVVDNKGDYKDVSNFLCCFFNEEEEEEEEEKGKEEESSTGIFSVSSCKKPLAKVQILHFLRL
ncbi:unnamed protein product [Lepeophtheirus salmonis]|uniref:(salmon louse) hypothetical protein n=1 Tax=Lepeophtheirus salmonis TaxID=72036 RepID=A0A7R8H345_LEPSM|nr:unnamed protein product [Lepeophtheirus salmonis]CAF2824070.1 unnamed protein product [Lepeophtheirus salmonis]